MRKAAISFLSGLFVLVAFLGALGVAQPGWMSLGTAHAQEDWRKEFEEVCAKTQDAMIFSPEELKGLIDRCDSLRPRIEKLDETQRKVYLKRLKLCRDLFSYVLESKENK